MTRNSEGPGQPELCSVPETESLAILVEIRLYKYQFRNIINEIDDELLNILKKRMNIIEQIGEYKKEHRITIFQLDRWKQILESRPIWAEKIGLPEAITEKMCQLLHEESIRIQTEIMNKK